MLSVLVAAHIDWRVARNLISRKFVVRWKWWWSGATRQNEWLKRLRAWSHRNWSASCVYVFNYLFISLHICRQRNHPIGLNCSQFAHSTIHTWDAYTKANHTIVWLYSKSYATVCLFGVNYMQLRPIFELNLDIRHGVLAEKLWNRWDETQKNISAHEHNTLCALRKFSQTRERLNLWYLYHV